ncbi:MAG: glycosyltransferase, partial [Verrucomicrobiota bacterium]
AGRGLELPQAGWDAPTSILPDRLQTSGKFFRSGELGDPFFVRCVTFGPFPLTSFTADEVREQLIRIKHELKANAVRFYDVPPIQWLHDCAEIGLYAFVTIPWTQHADFLSKRADRLEVKKRVREVVGRFQGHPAVAGYYVGNEIEPSLVRFLGPEKVCGFLEELIEIGRQLDPDALFAYANFPTTEYLLPGNQDFLAFNVYLEDPNALGRYLDRLQNLAGDIPLLISEFGADSQAKGLTEQAEILRWHIDEICRSGCAGTTVFAWTDLWMRGGAEIDGWDFGLTDREQKAKPAFDYLAQKWGAISSAIEGVELKTTPRFSIVICTYKGCERMREVLESTTKINYPDYEVIVVNDGDDNSVRQLVSRFDSIQHVGIDHGGLSNARNVGAETATGEIIAYTDDDCILEPDWLSWLALAFEHDEQPDCVGGPNLAPPAK